MLVEGPSEEHELVMVGRHAGQAPEIDGQVYLSGGEVLPGQMRRVRITQASDYDLVGELLERRGGAGAAPSSPGRGSRRRHGEAARRSARAANRWTRAPTEIDGPAIGSRRDR